MTTRYEVTTEVWREAVGMSDVMSVRVLDTLTGQHIMGLIDMSRGWTFAMQVQNAALNIDRDRLSWLDRSEWRWGDAWNDTILDFADRKFLSASL